MAAINGDDTSRRWTTQGWWHPPVGRAYVAGDPLQTAFEHELAAANLDEVTRLAFEGTNHDALFELFGPGVPQPGPVGAFYRAFCHPPTPRSTSVGDVIVVTHPLHGHPRVPEAITRRAWAVEPEGFRLLDGVPDHEPLELQTGGA